MPINYYAVVPLDWLSFYDFYCEIYIFPFNFNPISVLNCEQHSSCMFLLCSYLRFVAMIYQAETTTRCMRPLFASRVSAGFPSPAEDFVEGSLDLNRHLIDHPVATFFLRISMDRYSRKLRDWCLYCSFINLNF